MAPSKESYHPTALPRYDAYRLDHGTTHHIARSLATHLHKCYVSSIYRRAAVEHLESALRTVLLMIFACRIYRVQLLIRYKGDFLAQVDGRFDATWCILGVNGGLTWSVSRTKHTLRFRNRRSPCQRSGTSLRVHPSLFHTVVPLI